MGNWPLSVQPSCPDDVLENCKFGSKFDRAINYEDGSPLARPGYFKLGLAAGFEVEVTTTQHAALWNFHFDSNGSDRANATLSPLFLLDLTDLSDSRQNASISVDPATARIKANGTFLPSFGVGSYQSYVCVDLKGAAIRDTGVWVNDRAGREPKRLFVDRGYSLYYIQAGGFVRFDEPPSGSIQARVGVSFVSTERACANAESEIDDWDFSRIVTHAETLWRAKLSPISVVAGGASEALQRTFFSAVYRTMLSPQNYTGENPLWRSSRPYFDSFYCIWDSFRTDFPYLTILDPNALTQMVESLVDTYTNLGWMPDCRMQLCKGYSQGGSNADVVLADAYVKNLTGDADRSGMNSSKIDWKVAYEAVKKDAEVEPFDWGVNGRGGLQSWKSVGYIPVDDFDYLGFGPPFHSISRSLEYAYDDFCVATIAKGLGYDDDYTKYITRSGNWRNLFKADQESHWQNGTDTGFVGFFQPRYSNRTWRYQDPMECSPLDEFCSYSSNPKETFESAIWCYQFYVPHEESTNIELLGGPERFVERLDYLHTSGLLDIGNEPSELNCFQYHYAGRPGRSSYRLRTYLPGVFNATPSGLPGNDDSGASGSFIAFAMTGLFPIAGQNVYLIVPPYFQEVRYRSPTTNRTATIRNVNFDASGDMIYIQKATLNGQTYTKSWIGHEFFLEGQTLELTLGLEESAWGTRGEDLPPSLERIDDSGYKQTYGSEYGWG
ncbi:glycoside hydrolase family 92 protein [Polychaeton citri CBS 116435]|uniref:Glycoside hydrolase family 92 protein n=1 Tax=Polychaeton citri CBS 116435 TaxID=1314669 RepID=A0A9P4Q1C4_9PEZI|nr:glycoside hydrolase family 92 protein [Polychaeton citri CBS 116435]